MTRGITTLNNIVSYNSQAIHPFQMLSQRMYNMYIHNKKQIHGRTEVIYFARLFFVGRLWLCFTSCTLLNWDYILISKTSVGITTADNQRFFWKQENVYIYVMLDDVLLCLPITDSFGTIASITSISNAYVLNVWEPLNVSVFYLPNDWHYTIWFMIIIIIVLLMLLQTIQH